MKKLLIIYPHWYPSNLAGVHRARLVGNYLQDLGWQPHILTVKPEHYDETPDVDMHRLFSSHFIEYRVEAFKTSKIRIIGDIGLRAFVQLYQKAKEIICTEKPDFLWIPIPSFYTALLGRLLHEKTGIAYGIDYIDPWVRDISKDGSIRAKISLNLAKLLEPFAVKKASLITGVAYEYYKPVLERNFNTEPPFPVSETSNPQTFKSIHHAAFPYGFDPHDHEIEIPGLKLPWDNNPECKPIVYAGAFMPNSQMFLDTFFKAFAALVKENKVPPYIHFYFLGTGFYPHKSITAYAADHGISSYVTEIRDRFPFLHILNFLSKADKLLIIGSTEKHYTASKTYQVILGKRPFMGMFHFQSTALEVMHETQTDEFAVSFDPDKSLDLLYTGAYTVLNQFLNKPIIWKPDLTALTQYSAKQSAKVLVDSLEKVLENKN